MSGQFLRKLGFLCWSVLSLLGIHSELMLAQQVNSQLRGTVADATGAFVPGAEVKATNTQTNVAATVSSGNGGDFVFLQLPAGTYDLTVTKTGFSTNTVRAIPLTVGNVYTLPVILQVGNVSQAVEVQASAAQVETSATQLGNVIEARRIVNLPLVNRNWVSLSQLVPGVVSSSDTLSSNYSTNGSQSQQNSFLINGADSIDLPLNSPSIIPSPDAIAEFNLITSTINPEYGRNSGGILNAIIKSGTNQFTGDAFEFYRDTFLNGRNLYQKTKPVFHQNQFGGTFGGPVWKDHTFFFLSYQGSRYRRPEPGVSSSTTVFTDAQRTGSFPALATSSATSPFPLVGENGQTYASGTPYRAIFPTGHIPNADYNPISQKLLAYVPAANTPGGLFSFNPTRTGSQDQGLARVDHTFGPKDSVWVNIFFENDPYVETLPFTGSTLPGFGDTSTSAYQQYSTAWTHTFNGSTLNEVRLSYLRFNFQTVTPQTPTLPSTLGFAINPQNTTGAGIPRIELTGYFNLGFSSNGPQPRIDETYELADNFSKVIGAHTLKFGFDGKRYGVNNPFYGNNNGVYAFAAAGQYSTGDAGADFLLGIPDNYTQGSGGYIVARTYEYYAYAQDSWKVNNNLTVNYGAGYQIDTPLNNLHFGGEAFNCFRPGQKSSTYPTAPAGLLFPGDTGCTASGYYPHYDHVGPRFGFAYSPGNGEKKFVIRGGFGIYFNRSEEELELQDLGAVPFSLTSTGIGDIGGNPAFANPYRDIATGQTIANKFPFTPAKPGSTNVDFSFFEPFTLNTVDPNFTSPYAMNYNLNVQRELPGAMVLQLSVVGAQGRHLEMAYEGNPISPAGTAACAASSTCIANRSIQHLLYPSHAMYAPGDIFATVGTQSTTGVSNYNSLQASLQKRLSHGLVFQASYTYSHSIDDTSSFENSSFNTRGTNPFNFALNRGDSAFDARQRLVVSYDYELPHLSRFWNNGVVRRGLDGWHISGITTLQTGFPIPIGDTGFRSLTCDSLSYYACPDAPNYVSSPATYDPRTSSLVSNVRSATNRTALPYYYFNPNAFSLERIGTVGNEGRNNLHGPGLNNTDLSLSKRIYLTREERRFIELRLEGYNVFNHTQFTSVAASNGGNGVSGDINSSNFGRVLSAASGRVIQLGAKFYF